jgi:hypothetical protein
MSMIHGSLRYSNCIVVIVASGVFIAFVAIVEPQRWDHSATRFLVRQLVGVQLALLRIIRILD